MTPLGGAAGEFDVVLGAEITYLSASIGPLMSSIQALLSSSSSSSTLRGGGAGGGGGGLIDVKEMGKEELIEQLAKMPVALLTFTPELTAFDGGGASLYYYICVLCTAIYVSSYFYVCPSTTTSY